MRPSRLFHVIQEDKKIAFSRLCLGDREILRQVCGLICSSNLPGVFAPDIDVDGDISLADCVAIKHGSCESEMVACALEQLCHQNLICITSDCCIACETFLDRRSHSSALNGRLSIGRRRKGESVTKYKARAKIHRKTVSHADLSDQLMIEAGPLLRKISSPDEIHQVVRLPINLALKRHEASRAAQSASQASKSRPEISATDTYLRHAKPSLGAELTSALERLEHCVAAADPESEESSVPPKAPDTFPKRWSRIEKEVFLSGQTNLSLKYTAELNLFLKSK